MNSPIHNFGEIHKSLNDAYESAKVRALSMMKFAHDKTEEAERAVQAALDAVTDLEVATERLTGESVPADDDAPMFPPKRISDVLDNLKRELRQ